MRPARATVFLRVKYDKIIACHNMMEHAGRTPSRCFLRAARPPCFPRRAGARAEVDSRIACMFYKGLVCAAYSKRGPAFICLVLRCSQALGKIRECFATPQWLFRSLTRCCLSPHVNLFGTQDRVYSCVEVHRPHVSMQGAASIAWTTERPEAASVSVDDF